MDESMIDKRIATYALSMFWRFMITKTLVMFVLVMFIPFGMSQEEIINNPSASLILPVIEIVSVYAGVYLSLLWMSNTSAANKDSKREA